MILRDKSTLFSFYSSGDTRWEIEVPGGFESNLAINDRGDIYYASNNILIRVNRFGAVFPIKKDFKGKNIAVLNNSLIAYLEDNFIRVITFSGLEAWSLELKSEPQLIESVSSEIYLMYSNGDVESYSNKGLFKYMWNTSNKNPLNTGINSSGNLLIYGDSGVTLITKEDSSLMSSNEDSGLFYSNGLLIKSYSDWTLHGYNISSNSEFYPSGKKQTLKRTISLARKRVWGDEKKHKYYTESILGGKREVQKKILKDIESAIGKETLLDDFPNFYETLLLASSSRNPNQDIRQEGYRLIGKSRDLSFLPYLLSDLEGETSYMVLSYIYYALGQLSIDRTGEVIEMVNRRIDDYYDEKIVINALYTLYNINTYTNGEFIEEVFIGIEKILNAGYSRKIQNQCYEILKRMK